MLAKKAVVVGIDGLDYHLTNKYLASRLLPNLAKLKKAGFYSRLETTTPPQSPVAWASFITGAKPAKHGVFDFIVRDPETYLLHPVFSPAAKKGVLKSAPFWRQTTKEKIPAQILFLPVTYPPEKLFGQTISGMGAPDILGTEGAFTVFTTKEALLRQKRGIRIRLPRGKSKIETEIQGPKYKTFRGIEVAKIPLTLTLTKGGEAKIEVQGQKISLKEGKFSRWINLEFKIGPFKSIKGIARFFLKSAKPDLILYLSPINIDPGNPVFAISYPEDFAARLAQKYGLFSTLGLPHDTWALQEEIFAEEDFLLQAEKLLTERGKIIFGQLEEFKEGLFVAYFGNLDSIQHMFLKELGKKGRFKDVVTDYYQKMDGLMGKTAQLIDEETLLVVLSDHGFGPFNWEVNLNTWLLKNGFLALKSGKSGGELYENVDWGKTAAFAAGFNSIYINVRGREKEGMVSPQQANKIASEIKSQLRQLKHPTSKKPVIKNVYSKKELGVPKEADAPDLIVGYHKGFRASWETAVGATPEEIIKKRTQKWGADHLFDASEVPGVIFANQGLKLKTTFIGEVMAQVIKKLSG